MNSYIKLIKCKHTFFVESCLKLGIDETLHQKLASKLFKTVASKYDLLIYYTFFRNFINLRNKLQFPVNNFRLAIIMIVVVMCEIKAQFQKKKIVFCQEVNNDDQKAIVSYKFCFQSAFNHCDFFGFFLSCLFYSLFFISCFLLSFMFFSIFHLFTSKLLVPVQSQYKFIRILTKLFLDFNLIVSTRSI